MHLRQAFRLLIIPGCCALGLLAGLPNIPLASTPVAARSPFTRLAVASTVPHAVVAAAAYTPTITAVTPSGPVVPSETLTITATGFNPSTTTGTISFSAANGIGGNATGTAQGSNGILVGTIVVPAGARAGYPGTATITVTPVGTTGSSPSASTDVLIGTPTLDIFGSALPPTATIYAGSNVPINGAGFTANSPVSVTFTLTHTTSTSFTNTDALMADPVGNFPGGAGNSYLFAIPANAVAGVYTVMATDANGLSATISPVTIAMSTTASTVTPTPVSSATPTVTPPATPTVAPTPVPSATPPGAPTATNTTTATATATPTPVATSTVTPSLTTEPTQTARATATPIATALPTARASSTATPAAMAVTAPQSTRSLAVQANLIIHPPHGSVQQFSQILRLLVPTGAVTSGVTLELNVPSVNAVPRLIGNAGQQDNIGVGLAYNLMAVDARTHQQLHTFPKLLIIQLTYDLSQMQGIAPSGLHISFFDPATQTWKDLPTTIDTFHNTLTATTNHLTLFQVRATTRSQAQITQARARLAALAAAGNPHLSSLPAPTSAVGGVPLIITLPTGRQKAPVTVQVLGAPNAQVRITYMGGGTSTLQTLALDGHGYTTTAFVPGNISKKPQLLTVTVLVTSGSSRLTLTRTITLLPGRTTGPLPPGAPPLSETLTSAHVTAGATGPVLTVSTTPGARVNAALRWAGKPLSGVKDITGTAGRTGVIRLQMPRLPRARVLAHAHGKPPTLTIQVIVTATLRAASTQQSLNVVVSNAK